MTMEKTALLSHRAIPWLVVLGVLPVLLVGCAKRPATTTAAPAPTAITAGMAASGSTKTPSSGAAPTGTTAGMAAPGTTPETPSSGLMGAGAGSGSRATGVSASLQPPSPKEFTAMKDLKAIHFDFDRYDIRPGDAKVLDENAGWMKANPNHLILIEGHCDERGTNEYNLALGERRAKATMNYLVAQGVAANRMTLISYGEERPLCAEKNEGCWSQNRRGDFLVKLQESASVSEGRR